MDGIEICEICGGYVNEGDLTECRLCKKECCMDCMDYEELLCDKCISKKK